MTGTIQIIQNIKVENGSFKFPDSDIRRRSYTQTGQGGAVPGTLTVPTTATGTLIDLTALTTPGWARFKNVDPTNFIKVGLQVGGTFYPFARLLPGAGTGTDDDGQEIIVPMEPGISVYAVADTAAAKLLVQAFEA